MRDPQLPDVGGAPSLARSAAPPLPRRSLRASPRLLTIASRRAAAHTASRVPRLLFLSHVDAFAPAMLTRRGRRVATCSLPVHRGSDTMRFALVHLGKLRPGGTR